MLYPFMLWALEGVGTLCGARKEERRKGELGPGWGDDGSYSSLLMAAVNQTRPLA